MLYAIYMYMYGLYSADCNYSESPEKNICLCLNNLDGFIMLYICICQCNVFLCVFQYIASIGLLYLVAYIIFTTFLRYYIFYIAFEDRLGPY